MLSLTVNGESRTAQAVVLSEILRELGYEGRHFAVAVDGDFVPRSRYAAIQLGGGERLEVLSPLQGG